MLGFGGGDHLFPITCNLKSVAGSGAHRAQTGGVCDLCFAHYSERFDHLLDFTTVRVAP